ncbi:metallophosphoesterase [Roseibium suaedae]|uniref:Calcineurin-like phosphoesterase domain-containing protein n=1 Tax=Roseibium suaedae TaxID=735517 RepID=A0A1M7NJM4_9HYPH|nr:metallophosphoesterase [Roseibium suaedae]SHN04014.1 hypothetical protein SAMN05444272_3803 [Roseibium suaedae]
MFHLVTGFLGLFVALHVWPLLPKGFAFKAFSFALIMLVSQHHLITKLTFGTMFAAEIPRSMMIVVNILFATLVFAAVLFLALEILRIVGFIVNQRWLPLPPVASWLVLSVALALGGTGVLSAIGQPDVRRVEIPIRGLSTSLDGYRVVQLTDLHLSRIFTASWSSEVVERTNALEADAIVITGDLIDGTIADRTKDVAPLGNLKASDGVFVISGNHEYYFGHDAWMNHYEGLGMTRLANSHVVLGSAEEGLVLAGIPDLSAAGFGHPGPDLATALEAAPEDLPVVLLNHQPKMAADYEEAGVALQLSGHTHGGMIKGFDWLISKFNGGYVSGLYSVGEMTLYVSNGTALWPGFAVRLGVPAEITVFTLRTP